MPATILHSLEPRHGRNKMVPVGRAGHLTRVGLKRISRLHPDNYEWKQKETWIGGNSEDSAFSRSLPDDFPRVCVHLNQNQRIICTFSNSLLFSMYRVYSCFLFGLHFFVSIILSAVFTDDLFLFIYTSLAGVFSPVLYWNKTVGRKEFFLYLFKEFRLS